LGLGTATLPFGPAYVVSDIPASLLLNYSNGRPGSIFTLTGENFPPDTTVAIVVNGQTLENALPVLPSGDFVLFLAAEDGLNGDYGVTVSGYAGAIAQLHLRDWAPIRRQEGGGQTIALSGVVPVQFRQTFLPVVGLEIPAAPGRR
jgi:hypothetical protein